MTKILRSTVVIFDNAESSRKKTQKKLPKMSDFNLNKQIHGMFRNPINVHYHWFKIDIGSVQKYNFELAYVNSQ